MLLKSIKLNNFRQFIGIQKINFETDLDKNITVILGKNTSGKTTLIKSFKWILYGISDFETKGLLNETVAENLEPREKEKVSGELNLLHNGTEYIIKREQDYFRTDFGEIKPENARLLIQHKTENGQLKFLDKSKLIDTINKILPEDLADYFFFHGEQIKEIGENKRSGKKNIKEAVESMLGLKTLNSAINHLSGGKKISVIGKLKNRIDSTGNEKLESAKNELKIKENELEKVEGDINDYQETIEALEESIVELDKKIKDNKPAKELKTQIENNRLEIKEIKSEKRTEVKNLTKLISQKSPMFFMQPLLKTALKLIDDYKDYQEGIPEMHAKSIEYIINERKKCLCGQEIEKDSDIFNNLMELKKYLPPESIGTIIRLFKKDINHYRSHGNDFYNDFKRLYTDIRKKSKKIKELESQNENFSEQIEDKPDVGALESEVKKINSNIKERRKKLKKLIKRKGELDNSIKSLNKEIESLAEKDEKNSFILQCLKYAEYINNQFENHYNELEINIKDRLENRTKEIFNRIYHGNRDIVLKNNYEYILTTDDTLSDKELDKSEGLKTVASFSFIAGIVSLAKEKVHDTNENIGEMRTEPYPLVMDAPFSDTDEKHIQNISKVIPEVTEQTIMIIMKKDWKYAKAELKKDLSKIYEMRKEKETITKIIEVN